MFYFDHNATTPLDPVVLDAMLPFLKDNFGNAHSRTHGFGWLAEDAVAEARRSIAEEFGVMPEEIFFTGGATESINTAIKGVVYGNKPVQNIITNAAEHKAVLETVSSLPETIARTFLNVDEQGRIDIATNELATQNSMAVFMAVNNETGVITDLEGVSTLGDLLFIDATQAVGKLEIKPNDFGINLMAFSGHKIYGPKGIGGLYIDLATQKRLSPLIHGGSQERGLRSGTLNVPGIIGLAKALEVYKNQRTQDAEQIGKVRDYFEAKLLNSIADVEINAHQSERIYNTSSIYIEGVDSEDITNKIGNRLAVANGSACTSASIEPSHVLQAMGFSEQRAMGSLRFSFGRSNTIEQIDQAIELLAESIESARAI